MSQNIQIVITGKDTARFAKMMGSLDGIDAVIVKLTSLQETVLAEADDMPNLFILALDEQWKHDFEKFLTIFKNNVPLLIVIGPSQNSELMRRAMQIGAKDYLNSDVNNAELRQSVIQLLDTVRENQAQHDSQMIVSISPKGSSEAAFLTSNLAYFSASLSSSRTLALDLDLQFGSLPLFLDLNLGRSILHALEDNNSLDVASLEAYLSKHNSGLFVAATDTNDMVLPGEVSVANMGYLLKVLNTSFERVFISIPMQIDLLNTLILKQADKIVIVVEQDIICLRNSTSLVAVMQEDMEIPKEKITIVINRYHKNRPISLSDIQEALGGATAYVIPDDMETVNESINIGEPLLTSAPKASVTKSLLSLAEGLNEEKFEKAPGFFNRVISYVSPQ